MGMHKNVRYPMISFPLCMKVNYGSQIGIFAQERSFLGFSNERRHFLSVSIVPFRFMKKVVQRQLLLPVATIRIAGLGPARRDDAVGIERRRSPGALFHCH